VECVRRKIRRAYSQSDPASRKDACTLRTVRAADSLAESIAEPDLNLQRFGVLRRSLSHKIVQKVVAGARNRVCPNLANPLILMACGKVEDAHQLAE
jgi:hypothetical protein